MNLTITPNKLKGTITPPPSKSQAHRLIIAAALAKGTSTVENVALSQDIKATLRCTEALGTVWTLDGSTLQITGIGDSTLLTSTKNDLPHFDCGESGSTLRFLIPIALAVAGGGVFTGQGRLMERPQKPYFDLFEEKGIAYEQDNGVLTIRGKLTPGEYRLAGDVSSQFFTGLLYALPLLDGDSTIVSTTKLESVGYISMTREAMGSFGVTSKWKELTFTVPGKQCFQSRPNAVEADWSQAAFWYAAQALGSDLDIQGMNTSSTQGDMVIASHYLQLTQNGGVEIDLSQCPDLAPPLAAMAAVRQGTTVIGNAGRLRIKESDRLATITATLNALGAKVTEEPDGLTIIGQETLAGGVTIDCCNDHRIAMMAAIAATACRAPVTLTGAECVKKSYPNFWEDYKKLGGLIHEHTGQ